MKKRILLQLCLIIAGTLYVSQMKATQTLTVCNCANLSYTCTYVITVNIQACDRNHLHCVSMSPQTQTIAPGTCYTFSFNPPVGDGLVYSSATFSVTNTSNSATANFSAATTSSPGNCFDASGSGGGVTDWTANGAQTSYTICPDLIVWDVKNASATKKQGEVQAGANRSTSTTNPKGPGIETTDSYNIYPNPTSSEANVSINSSKNKTVKVEVFNWRHETVYSQDKELMKGENAIKIDGLSEGIYYVLLHTEEGIITRKFSVQK
jgi:hypothetical protein